MYQIYQVMPFETLEDVAKKLQLDIEQLKKINGITANQNIGGSYIIIPAKTGVRYETYKVKKGDNVYSIAKKHHIDYDSLLKLNGLDEDDYIYPDEELLIPQGDYKVYIVNENDTLSSVASKLGKDVEQLTRINQQIFLLPDQVIHY